MKRMKVIAGLLLGALAMFGVTEKVCAFSYVTVQSSAVHVGSAPAGSFNVLEVIVSTPPTTTFTKVILVDSNTLTFNQTAFTLNNGVLVATQNITCSQFTADQYIIPPFQIVPISTMSFSNFAQGVPIPNRIPIGGPFGYTVRNGFVVCIDGGGSNVYAITTGIEQAPIGGYPRRY